MHIINQSCSDRCIDDAIACEYELSDPADHHLLEILQELGEVTTRNLGTLILFSCEKEVLAHIITEHDDLKTPANSIGDQ
ncbi:MAG: hypothetical protein GX268_04050 [Methanomicrobiales archaeon]|nr:hypothetical protein [Methanomicrobiales archaeon]